MLKNMKLGTRIGVGFSAVILVLIAVAVFALVGLRDAENGFIKYRAMAKQTNISGRLQANMLMVRMNVKDYVITHSDKDLREYQSYIDKMNTFMDEALHMLSEAEHKAVIEETKAIIAQYEMNFKQVIKLVESRNEAVSARLDPNGLKMRESLTELVEEAYQHQSLEGLHETEKLIESLLLGRLYVNKYLTTNKADDYNFAAGQMQGLLAKVKKAEPYLTNSKDRALLRTFKNSHKVYTETMEEIFNAIEARNDIISNKLDKMGPKVAMAIEDVKLAIMASQDELGPQLQAENGRAITVVTVFSFVATLLAIVFAYLVTASITKPIMVTVVAANRIADGDLSNDIVVVGVDETAQLQRAIKGTTEKLRHIIGKVSGASTEVAKRAEQLSSLTLDSSKGAQDQQYYTGQVATAMSEMAERTQNVAENAQRAAGAAGEADAEASLGFGVVEQTVATINRLATNVEKTAEKLASLEVATTDIGGILDVIRDIADQTNLLALNAAIEAARAGEQGRGFAVVADEVRSLAQRTQESTQEIQTLIERLQGDSKQAVHIMNEGRELAGSSVDQASKAGEALSKITHMVATINTMNAEISSAVDVQQDMVSGVNKNVTDVNRIAGESTQGIEKISSASAELATLAEDVQTLLSQFKIS